MINLSASQTSIVVLSYNGLEETTRPCIESILNNTSPGSYELIVVDNCSSDGTQAFLVEIAGRHTHIKLCLNDTNKGYAGGNNDGLRLANGEFVVLINNDTLVPRGWLERLIKMFQQDSKIGMVGPVTNSAGNEQRIELEGINESNYEALAAGYTSRQSGVWFETEKLGFYCVALRRSLVEEIGYLDEQFGIGMFEDDDYCIRARRTGYKFVVVEDCFVFHKGSVSFNKLSVGNYKFLFEKNRSYFREKHQLEWTLTDLAFSYWDKFGRDLNSYLSEQQYIIPEIERVLVRFDNFKHLLVQIRQAELKAYVTDQSKLVKSPSVSKAIWHTRWRNIKSQFLHGTNKERIRFVSRIIRGAANKISITKDKLPDDIITQISVIRDENVWSKVIIIPATIDFSYMEQRPQHLARAFAQAGYLVIYGSLNHTTDSVAVSQKIDENLYLVHEQNFGLLNHVFKPEDMIYYCMWPNNRKHLTYLRCSILFYDYMDELTLLDLPDHQVLEDHDAMITKADLITVSSRQLMTNLPDSMLGKTKLIPNAVSGSFLSKVKKETKTPSELVFDNRSHVIGYYGALAEWVDYDLIEALARELKDVFILLIGPVSNNVQERISIMLNKNLNISVLPPKQQYDLIPYLQRFDVCIIPFKKNLVTDAISPVKLYEYLGAGKPVVATDIEECSRIDLVNTAGNYSDFIKLVKSSILHENTMELTQTLIGYAQKNTWANRVEQILANMETL